MRSAVAFPVGLCVMSTVAPNAVIVCNFSLAYASGERARQTNSLLDSNELGICVITGQR